MSQDQEEAFEQILSRVIVRDHARRRKAMDEAKAFIRSIDDKWIIIGPTLRRLVANRMEDGFDLARALLLEVGEPILDYTESFVLGQMDRWASDKRLGVNVDDDVVYVLLHALGDAKVDHKRAITAMEACLMHGNPSARDAAIWGLGNLETPEAYALVRSHGLIDCSSGVREAAKMVLEDQEVL